MSLFHHVLRYLRTLYIVWSPVRRRVTRGLIGLQNIHNVLKICKHFKRLRFGCDYFFNFNLLMFSTVAAMIIAAIGHYQIDDESGYFPVPVRFKSIEIL